MKICCEISVRIEKSTQFQFTLIWALAGPVEVACSTARWMPMGRWEMGAGRRRVGRSSRHGDGVRAWIVTGDEQWRRIRAWGVGSEIGQEDLGT